MALTLPAGIYRDPLNFARDGFHRTQAWGPNQYAGEPKVAWPGGFGLAKGTYANFHQGVDWANGASGSPVYAPCSGLVDFAGVDGTGDRLVRIVNGRYRAWHDHMKDVVVAKGQTVSAGKVIGHVGASGHATGPHLHWAVEWLDLPGVEIAWFDGGGSATFEFIPPEPRLLRNVTAHPVADAAGVRLRTAPNLSSSSIYAVADNGRITRTDGTDLGAVTDPRKYLGVELNGATYPGGGNDWDAMLLDGRTLYCARPYVVRSV